MQVEEVERSLSKKILGIAFFIVISISALYWFFHVIQQLTSDLLKQTDLIVFDKGAMYLLGVGGGIGVLTVFLIADAMKKELSHEVHKRATRILLLILGLTFVLPQVMDFGVHRYIERINYVHCEDQSHQWFHAHTYVFATDLTTCTTYRSEDREKTGSEAKAENPRPRRTNPRHPQIY